MLTIYFVVPRNYDPSLHPMEAAREYVRALNAVKLDRVFAKPFIGNLGGHRDGVSCFAKHPTSLSTLVSGSYDGEVRVWDLANRCSVRDFKAHVGFVRGVAYSSDGSRFFTVGDDKKINFWKADISEEEDEECVNTILSRTMVSGITHNRRESTFATCGEVCILWDENRNNPIKTLKWGVDSLHAIAYNPVETSLLSCCASDRSIIMYDTREDIPIRKIVLSMKSNKLAWNPMEAFNFTVANEDCK